MVRAEDQGILSLDYLFRTRFFVLGQEYGR
jgi:hypothetical protein